MLSLGIDIGTSGVRAVVLNKQQQIIAQAQYDLEKSKAFKIKDQILIGYSQNPLQWWHGVEHVIQAIKSLLEKKSYKLQSITHLAIDGTSGTVLLADKDGNPLYDALMYNDQRSLREAETIKKFASDNTAAMGASSGLAKILYLHQQQENKSIAYALNQADWISGKFLGQYGISDCNNALKMGYDAQLRCWPDWVKNLLIKNNISPPFYLKYLCPVRLLLPLAMTLHNISALVKS